MLYAITAETGIEELARALLELHCCDQLAKIFLGAINATAYISRCNGTEVDILRTLTLTAILELPTLDPQSFNLIISDSSR